MLENHLKPNDRPDQKPSMISHDKPENLENDLEPSIEIETPEQLEELTDNDIRAVGQPFLPPETAIFERRKGKDKESSWSPRTPETEKDPIRSIDILKNQFLSSLEEAIPKAIEKEYHFEDILRNAGFTNAELRSISSPQEFGNLLAQIQYESAEQLFYKTGYAPDDATFILNQGKYPHYREQLTLGTNGTIIKREPYDLGEHLKELQQNNPETARLVKKFIEQKAAIQVLNHGLNIIASKDGWKK